MWRYNYLKLLLLFQSLNYISTWHFSSFSASFCRKPVLILLYFHASLCNKIIELFFFSLNYHELTCLHIIPFIEFIEVMWVVATLSQFRSLKLRSHHLSYDIILSHRYFFLPYSLCSNMHAGLLSSLLHLN